MSHCGYITTLKNVREHPNADKLVLATCFENTVCVAKDKYFEGQVGVYFETDLQLSMEFCEKNGLLAVYENGINVSGGYMDPAKRNVRAIKLRGEQSDGLFLPLDCLAYTGVDLNSLTIGSTVTVINGHEICKKFIPVSKTPRTAAGGAGKRVKRRAKRQLVPTFFEHKDTEQLAYNLHAFKEGDEIEITLKMHGTSQRTGYHKVFKGYKDNLGHKAMTAISRLLFKITGKYGKEFHGAAIYDWDYVTGTRRTVLDGYEGGFYGSNEFRAPHANAFTGKLWKGETVYYEVVGFTTDGTPIMATCSNEKLRDKDFIKQYGKTTTFSYGCSPTGGQQICVTREDGTAWETDLKPQSDIYVYRMTMTNEDGDVVEYTPDFMRYRCEQMGIKTVPVLGKTYVSDGLTLPDGEGGTYVAGPGEFVLHCAKQLYDGPDPIGLTHVREGVVVRILNRPTFTAYKLKNWFFKALEGIVKVEADAPDMEEVEELIREAEAEAENVE